VLIFDEATSNLDQETAEHFAKTVNGLKGQATMLFITHQVPKGLRLDEVVNLRCDEIRDSGAAVQSPEMVT
jgi:subfamily B ATP-binding cassette protein HlyB/CyaB